MVGTKGKITMLGDAMSCHVRYGSGVSDSDSFRGRTSAFAFSQASHRVCVASPCIAGILLGNMRCKHRLTDRTLLFYATLVITRACSRWSNADGAQQG